MIENRRILVLGATGRVGRPLAEHLARRNTVFGVARFSKPDAEAALRAAGVRTIRKDLADAGPSLLEGIPADVDLVVNQAVLWKPDEATPWQRIYEVNVHMGPRVLAHCRGSAKAYVYGSTGGVYPRHATKRMTEEDEPSPDGKTYPVSKLCGEAATATACRLLGIPGAILRYYFPCSATTGVVRGICAGQMRGQERRVSKGDGYVRAFTWMDDVVLATEKALEVASIPPAVVNVAGNEAVSEGEAARRAAEALGIEARVRESEEVRVPYLVDNSKMRRLLGEPRGTFEQMLRGAVAALKAGEAGAE